MEDCNSCPCTCKPISEDCVIRFSEISDPTILKESHWQKATDDIDDLIGEDCASELCAAISVAIQEANAANETDYLPYLATAWVNVISNKHFKKWYANRLLFHWLRGASISEIKASGLITQSNNDEQYKNSFQQAQEKERQRLEDATAGYSLAARGKFINEYWLKNTNLYSCAVSECGCTKTNKCKAHCKKIGGLGFKVV